MPQNDYTTQALFTLSLFRTFSPPPAHPAGHTALFSTVFASPPAYNFPWRTGAGTEDFELWLK
jgi:hypothetical protein